MSTALVEAIANAIQTQEGYYPGTRAFRNNNPGNIWDGLIPGVKTQRIWPQYPIDADGFLVLPDYATGRDLMIRQIEIKLARGETLTQLINEWDSSDSASTRATYVANVATATRLNPLVALNTMGADPPNPTRPLPAKRRRPRAV